MSKAINKKGTNLVRLLVPAGKASPSPPVGPALGQRGVKSMDFCKAFNDQTKHIIPSTPMRAYITVKTDRTFTFVVKSPQTSWFLKQAAGIEKGTARCGHVQVGELSMKHIYEIAAIKVKDPGMEDITLEAMTSRVLYQAKSIGINVLP